MTLKEILTMRRRKAAAEQASAEPLDNTAQETAIEPTPTLFATWDYSPLVAEGAELLDFGGLF